MNTNSFAEVISNYLSTTSKTMKQLSEELNVPYRTLQDWKNGKRTPNNYVQTSVKIQLAKLNHQYDYYLSNQSSDIIRIDSNESISPLQAIEKVKIGFNVVEILKTGEVSSKIYPQHCYYVLHSNDGLDTGYCVVIE